MRIAVPGCRGANAFQVRTVDIAMIAAIISTLADRGRYFVLYSSVLWFDR